MTTIKYVAKKQFKYDGKTIKAGGEWKPNGAKFDAQVKEHLVNTEEITKRPAKRKAANGAS